MFGISPDCENLLNEKREDNSWCGDVLNKLDIINNILTEQENSLDIISKFYK